jgi:hypothetical protein
MRNTPSHRAVSRKICSSTALLLAVCTLAVSGYAQQSSHAATIALTATVSQSMTMHVSQPTVGAASTPLMTAGAEGPVAVTANWVLGPGNISVAVLSSGNPLLGRDAISRVPVATLSPLFPLLPSPADPAQAEGFLPSAKAPMPANLLELRIDTSDLQLPAGGEGGVLTIRAQAF